MQYPMSFVPEGKYEVKPEVRIYYYQYNASQEVRDINSIYDPYYKDLYYPDPYNIL